MIEDANSNEIYIQTCMCRRVHAKIAHGKERKTEINRKRSEV